MTSSLPHVSPSRCARGGAVALLLSALLAAQGQVFVVDAQNGAGASFTDLPQAVAAVPDGSALVVRPGSYTAFALAGKGVAIVGEDRSTVRIDRIGAPGNNVLLESTGPAQSILLRNLSIDIAAPLVRNALGPVVFDQVSWTGHVFSFSGVRVEQSANVQFHRCDLAVAPAYTCLTATDSVVQLSYTTLRTAASGFSSGGGDALALTRSRCVAYASTVRGDAGSVGCCGSHCYVLGSPGGDGVLALDGSTFYSHDSAVAGGRGGNTTEVNPGCGGGMHPGGAGIRLLSGSHAVFAGPGPVGGPGYQSVGPPGPPFVLQQGSTIQQDPGAVPSAGEARGPMALGATLEFTLQASGGSLGVLLLASDGTLVPIEPLVNGSFLAFYVSAHPLGAVPAGGSLQLPLVVPPNFPLATVFHGQFLTLDAAANRIWATNAFPLNVNS